MKISKLPVAEHANDTDIIPIVQNGETKQVTREKLCPPVSVPTGLVLDGEQLHLEKDGKPVGAGVEIPTTETTVWKTADWLDKPLPIDSGLHYFEIKYTADRPNPTEKPDLFTANITFRFYAANRETDPENPNREIYIPTMRGMPKIYNEYSGNSYTTALEPCQLTLMIGGLSVEHFMMAVFTEFKVYGVEWIPFGLWAPATTPNRPTFLEWNAGIFLYDMNAVPTEVLVYLNEILQNIRETENYQIRLTRFPSEEKPAEVIQ